MSDRIENVVVCGSGLAFELTCAALQRHLPNTIGLTSIELRLAQNFDSFYGHITAPTAYNFFVSLGLDEPTLLRSTQTNFTFGTAYESWAGRLNWVQCYQQPLPVWDNVLMHQYATKMQVPLAPFLIGGVAGLNGRFAHPPNDETNPLSRAEYGFVFDPKELTALLKSENDKSRIVRITSDVADIKMTNQRITKIELENGVDQSVEFLIDCCGPDGPFAKERQRRTGQTYSVKVNRTAKAPGFSLKHIKANPVGWESVIRLQDSQINLLTGVAGAIKEPDYDITLSHNEKAWLENCLAIGHAACVVEPLTPAPMILMQRDIERLLDLFPQTPDMRVEAKEYNRLFMNDLHHSELFTRALFEIANPPDSPYWKAARTEPCPAKLTRKIQQFESRGYLTMYDLEPFTPEDWVIQHFGLERRAERYDVYLDQFSPDAIKNRLMQVKTSIESMVQKMPPSDRYMENFKAYLDKTYGA